MTTGYSLRQILFYSENKVSKGVAECIAAVNYPKDLDDLTVNYKLNMLVHQAELNRRVQRNAMHFSLNFHPSDQPDNAKMVEIAEVYMNKIGLGQQPFLVYRHDDAGHSHMHIVSVKVRGNGERVETQNMGRNQSKKACKEIDKMFGLVGPGDHQKLAEVNAKKVNASVIQYGKTEIKKQIQAALDDVVNSYKYTSLAELNAVLAGYNIIADPGSDDSRTFNTGGLTYRVLDTDGKNAGKSIKASSFQGKPTLKYLQEKFPVNLKARQGDKKRIKNAIDLSFIKDTKLTLEALVKSLEREGISTVLHKSKQGYLFGITYIDHRTKAVFNGRDLDKAYAAKAIQQRCAPTIPQALPLPLVPSEKTQVKEKTSKQIKPTKRQHKAFYRFRPVPFVQPTLPQDFLVSNLILSTWEELFRPEYASGYVPYPLRAKKKKKKKRI